MTIQNEPHPRISEQHIHEVKNFEIYQCAIEVLCTQIPQIDQLMKTNIEALSEDFTGACKICMDLSSSEDVPALQSGINDIQGKLFQCMQYLQFQDRMTQHLEIYKAVLSDIVRKQSQDAYAKMEGIAVAQELFEFLKLGELKHIFIQHLRTHKYADISNQLEATFRGAEAEDDQDNVDLF